ncbi:hypothetical protein CHS0354_025051 [Potamilus streckersoni]|uniref:Uncharacterized protein n=1 Tax=Potamilus streckersoni TaxID=2493646 RepID=A0AAE0W949_9BIVA|nr:hypothetical protein CHS0354_025051 [Potamilus streckersoni]
MENHGLVKKCSKRNHTASRKAAQNKKADHTTLPTTDNNKILEHPATLKEPQKKSTTTSTQARQKKDSFASKLQIFLLEHHITTMAEGIKYVSTHQQKGGKKEGKISRGKQQGAFETIKVEATLDDINKAGNFLTHYYQEAYKEYLIFYLVEAASYLCEVNGYKAMPKKIREDTQSTSKIDVMESRRHIFK